MKIVVDTNIVFSAMLNPSAIPLVRDTDMDDIAFVVLAEYLDAKLWTAIKNY